MKILYDQDVDALTIILKQDTPVEESDEAKPGIILDYDSLGELVSIEILCNHHGVSAYPDPPAPFGLTVGCAKND
jgi:uncharacterized protein YuzE